MRTTGNAPAHVAPLPVAAPTHSGALPGSRRARGFSVLETLLAASIGAVLVLVCLGVMGAIERTEAAVAKRQNQVEAMTRLHLVMERAFGTLVMQNAGTPTSAASVRPTGVTATATATPQRDAIRNGVKELPPRPRFMIEADSAVSTDKVLGPFRPAGSTRNPGPQRLEVVLDKAPVPPGWGRDSTMEVMVAAQATEELRQGMSAVRGVFELRPDGRTPMGASSTTAAPDEGGWTLWWRPLPATSRGDSSDPYTWDPTQDPAAVAIVSGLVQCQWTAFKTVMENGKPKSREKMAEISAAEFQDLPAYMEMVVRTSSGLTANWMFELAWTNGPETSQEAEEQGTEDTGAGGPGGGPGGPGGGGSGRGGRLLNGGGGQGGRGGNRLGGRAGNGGGPGRFGGGGPGGPGGGGNNGGGPK